MNIKIEASSSYGPGTKAVIDSFSGLVPCIVQAVNPENPLRPVQVKITSGRMGYKRGEVLSFAASHVIPRNHIFRRGGKYRIRTTYAWVPQAAAPKD